MRYKAKLRPHNCSLLEELEYAKSTYGSAVRSLIPEAFALNHNSVMGILPTRIAEFLWDTKRSGTAALSNIPGPPTPQKMFGFGVNDLSVWLPLSRYNSGILKQKMQKFCLSVRNLRRSLLEYSLELSLILTILTSESVFLINKVSKYF